MAPQIKTCDFAVFGMQRDLAASKFNPKYAYENKNMRIAPIKDSTLASLTNERGNKYSVVAGIGDLFWEARLRKWYNKIYPFDIYKDVYYGEDPTGNVDVGPVLEEPYGEGHDLIGTPIGQNLLDNTLTVFTTELNDELEIPIEEGPHPDFEWKDGWINELPIPKNQTDRIYKLWLSNGTLQGKLLYKGHLGFDFRYPIETIGFYENSKIQKVYWTDGINQPRFINIAEKNEVIAGWTNTSFDFVRTVRMEESVSIKKNDSGGLFPAAAVQYVFTYYNLFGAESNIFYQSPLYFTSLNDRAASPEENTANSFTITISGLDVNYNFVRIYSIVRTSIDNVPTVKRVDDISIPVEKVDGKYTITYTDTNTNGAIIDPTELLYVGGEMITAYTFAQKDNTLFLGNIEEQRQIIDDGIRDNLRSYAMNKRKTTSTFKGGLLPSTNTSRFKFYAEHDVSLDDYANKNKIDSIVESTDCVIKREGYRSVPSQTNNINLQRTKSYFQTDEIYRIGIQFQHYTGKWSDAVWLGDYTNTVKIKYVCQEPDGYGVYVVPKGKLSLNDASTIVNELIYKGYRRARAVVVYPTINERINIAEGVLNPTLFTFKQRYQDHTVWAKASYFFRPELEEKAPTNVTEAFKRFRHLQYVGGGNSYCMKEIQGARVPSSIPITPQATIDDTDFSYSNANTYPLVDRSMVTFNSPDVEFDDSIKYIDYSDLMVKLIGTVLPWKTYTDTMLTTSTQPKNYWNKDLYEGEKLRSKRSPYGYVRKTYESMHGKAVIGRIAYLAGIENLKTEQDGDRVVPTNEAFQYAGNNTFSWPIYPWQQSGAINNDLEDPVSCKLKNKISSYTTDAETRFLDGERYVHVEDMAMWDSDQDTVIKLKDKVYKGNIDEIISTPRDRRYYSLDLSELESDDISQRTSDYIIDDLVRPGQLLLVKALIMSTPAQTVSFYVDDIDATDEYLQRQALKAFKIKNTISYLSSNAETDLDTFVRIQSKEEVTAFGETSDGEAVSPVSMKYKSTKHLVVDFGEYLLPYFSDRYGTFSNGATSATYNFYGEHPTYHTSVFSNGFGRGLWLAKICRDPEKIKNRFGGITAEALSNNVFVPCGEPVDIYKFDLDEDENIRRDQNGEPILRAADDIVVKWEVGDVRIQNYQCLKTYPFTLEDENSIVEILNFDVETRVNLAGRYDKNSYQKINTTALPSNFNRLNNIYDQKNTFFVYNQQNLAKINVGEYPNTITWTKTKMAGDETDKWTNITLASTFDFDGDKGKITKLLKSNEQILTFQDSSISQLLYNEQMQMTTEQGVPIEISNSGKITGKRYITEHSGCTNKWSICVTKNGVYYIDNINKTISLLTGEGPRILSDELGFHSWINSQSKTLSWWNPVSFNNFVTYYDRKNEDVLFFSEKDCLAYSEQLGQFTSFYSYERTPYYSPMEDRAIFISNLTDEGYIPNKYKIWFQHEGDYNMYFGQYRPFYTTVIANQEPQLDKVFNNVEFRSDTWEPREDVPGGWYLTEDTFDTLSAWNERQHKRETLLYNQGPPSNLKKKFNIWRAEMPRDWKNPLDRMRNPWLYVKLAMNEPNKNKTILHDMKIYYFG